MNDGSGGGRTPEETRLTLCATGYDPIPVKGKGPFIKGWQKLGRTNPDEIRLWTRTYADHLSTGILTARTPALDIDILDPEAAKAVEKLVREHFEERGYVLARVGRAPKRAIPFRCDQPFPKILRSFAAPHENERLELLGDGQQLVAFGIHVETGKPYSWFGGEPGEVERDELPDISREEGHELFDVLVKGLEPFGYQQAGASGNGAPSDDGAPVDWPDCRDENSHRPRRRYALRHETVEGRHARRRRRQHAEEQDRRPRRRRRAAPQAAPA